MNVEEMKSQILNWLSGFKCGNDFYLFENNDGRHRVCIFTQDHKYNIAFGLGHTGKTYLGCTVNARKALPGEDWTRGNDLHDGNFSFETWVKIMQDIISYELQPISDYILNKKTMEDLVNENVKSVETQRIQRLITSLEQEAEEWNDENKFNI